MVITHTRARYRATPDQRRRMAEIGIDASDDHRFTFAEFVQLFDAGILTEDDRVELIEGEIITMPPPNAPHANIVRAATRLLVPRIPHGFALDVQNPIRLRTDGVPLPGFAVVRDRDYDTLPTEADVLLVIEVSDSTLRYDRGEKLRTYARAGIPEVWIVNVGAREIERYTEPRDGQYGQKAVAQHGDTLASTTVPDIMIPVADVFR